MQDTSKAENEKKKKSKPCGLYAETKVDPP